MEQSQGRETIVPESTLALVVRLKLRLRALQRKPTVATVGLPEVLRVASYLSFMTGAFAAIAAVLRLRREE
jgi:hypothetical protein